MATRASLKALTAAFESLNNNNIVSGGDIKATELNAILTDISETINALVDAVFDNDAVTRLTGTFSGSSSLQNDALINASLSEVLLFVDGSEFVNRGYVDSFDATTGTLNFNPAISGDYKLYIFHNA